MKGTFKESEIEIKVIDLSEEARVQRKRRQMDGFLALADASRESFFEKEIVNEIVDEIHKKEDEQTAKDLVAQNKAMKATIALLEKCLDEAAEDRDRYKRQLDELNIMFDKYIRREKIIQGKGCWECSYCDPNFHVCKCRESDNYNELVGSECRCERYREYKPDA